jgi:DNA-binding response OmpR family regulator
VDDHPDTREALTELFAEEGFSAIAFEGALEAWSFLQSGARPTIILLDLEMPELSGWGFCTKLAHDPRLADVPVAVITATPAYRGVPARRVDAGVFRKPLDVDELVARVREYVDREAEKSKVDPATDQKTEPGIPTSSSSAEISKTNS